MAANLLELSVSNEGDAVGTSNGAESVGNHDSRAFVALHQNVERLLHDLLRVTIQRGSCLVYKVGKVRE